MNTVLPMEVVLYNVVMVTGISLIQGSYGYCSHH